MRKGLVLLGALIAAVAIAAFVVFNRLWLDSSTEIKLASPEAKAILSALTNAYDITAVVACQPDSDLNLLNSAFMDTPDFQPSSEQRAQVERVLGPQVADQAGYLSLLKAYYQDLRQPVAAVAPTPVGGVFPTARPILYCPDPPSKVELEVESIRSDGQKAVVRYDDGAVLQVAVLVRDDGRWLVVSIKAEALHF